MKHLVITVSILLIVALNPFTVFAQDEPSQNDFSLSYSCAADKIIWHVSNSGSVNTLFELDFGSWGIGGSLPSGVTQNIYADLDDTESTLRVTLPYPFDQVFNYSLTYTGCDNVKESEGGIEKSEILMPSVIETQTRNACNEEWYGTREYRVYWQNQFGTETIVHTDKVGIHGDISFVISPHTYESPFVLNTYIDDILIQQNWVDDMGNVFYTSLGDWNNLCLRQPSTASWAEIPEG